MFLVGGGILVHGWPWLYHLLENLTNVWSVLANMSVGVVLGLVVLGGMTLIKKLTSLGSA